MLNQDVVLTLLQASITGAGLVLAVYALIIPLYKRLFERNAIDAFEDLKALKTMFILSKPKYRLETIIRSWSFPTYLRFGVGATFFGYILTTLMSIAWVIDWEKTVMDSFIAPAFIMTTLIFLVVGLITIKDIHKIMRQDLNQMIENLKKDESKTQNEM